MTGGRREGSGRKRGVPQPRANALMAAAQLGSAKRPRRSRDVEEVALLRRLLSKYTKLAETAESAHDGEAFRVWSERVERVATTLLQHQARQPAELPANTRFSLAIFKDGKPVNLAPAADSTAAPVEEAAPEPAPAPATDQPQEPQPEAPPLPEPNVYGTGSTSLWGHPLFMSREWHGTRHHR